MAMNHIENMNHDRSKPINSNSVEFVPFTRGELILKRIMDILGGFVGCLLLLIATMFLCIPYLLSKPKDRGPMFYKQKRYGYHGKVFYIWKFRTMIVDAENYLENNPEIKKEFLEGGYKIENDPRVTKLGNFIRSKSIDELPQFINVLKGDMSLVGPRPIIESERKEYGDLLSYFESCKPGVTGYWATHGRSKVAYPERAELELKYLKLHSFGFDFLLLIQTVVQIFKGSEAY